MVSEQEAVITVSCGGDDEQNEKREEEESTEANQRDPAARFAFVSGSSKICSSSLEEKSASNCCYYPSIISVFQEFIYQGRLTNIMSVKQWCRILHVKKKDLTFFFYSKVSLPNFTQISFKHK